MNLKLNYKLNINKLKNYLGGRVSRRLGGREKLLSSERKERLRITASRGKRL